MSIRWTAAAASTVGTSHVKDGSVCQDSHQCIILPTPIGDETLVAIASDGAGSAPHSSVGSKLCCEVIRTEIEAFLQENRTAADITRNDAEQWLLAARARIEHEAEDSQLVPRDYACTLLVAVIGSQHSAFMQIGDGAIVVAAEDPDEDWAWIFWPQHGEYANTTNFITDACALQKLDFDAVSLPVTEMALFTDGLENLLLKKAEQQVHSPFFDSMMAKLRQSADHGHSSSLSEGLADYLNSTAINDKTDDDKTLILASTRNA